MTGCSKILVLACAALLTLVLAKKPGDFYSGDKPLWPVPKTCPPEDPKDHTVHLANDKDCTKFFTCIGGNKIPQDCPFADTKGNKLHFNRILQVCDWPERAMCADNSWTTWTPGGTAVSGTTETTTTASPPTSCTNQLDGTYVPDEDFCFIYYECQNGEKGVPKLCPHGQQFYPNKQSCDIPDGTCKIPIVNCPSNGIIFIPHDCCNWVFVCSEGKMIPLSCGKEHHWNMDTKNCTKPEYGTCAGDEIC